MTCAWPGILVALLLLVPFLNKAHTIDDVTFLLAAEQVLRDPLHPTAFDVVSEGSRVRVSSRLATGPVMAYLLVPSVLMGGVEWAAHAVQLALVAAAVLATTALALRLGLDGRAARLAGLLLATTPAMAALATTSMPDVPAMAFGVLGLERLYAWKAERRWVQALTASLAFALAGLSRSHLVLLLGVAALALLPSGEVATARIWRSVPRVLWLPLAAAAVLLWAVTQLTADPSPQGADVAVATLGRFTSRYLARNSVAFAVHWVLVLPLALPWLALRWTPLLRGGVLWVAIVAATGLLLASKQWRWVAWIGPTAGLGAAVLTDVLVSAWRRRDQTQLVLGAWLLLALPVVAYVQMPSKYLVPSAPAVALLVARALAENADAIRRVVAWGAMVAGAGLAVLVIRADANFADLGRRAANELIAPQVRQGVHVWADGDWGFLWYAIRAGAQPLAYQPPHPAPGDVVVASGATPGARLHWLLSRRLIATISDTSPGGRIMSVADGAGFYSNHHGYLPWAWGRGELERINVWQIVE